MINKISFTGKAYFLDNVKKTIAPEHKKRIENYAKKLDESEDVVVFGQEARRDYVYQGKVYARNQVRADLNDNDMSYKIETPNGVIKASLKEVGLEKTLLPIYNAYIIAPHNKEDMSYMPNRKCFDFTEKAENVLIRPDNRVEKDTIEY